MGVCVAVSSIAVADTIASTRSTIIKKLKINRKSKKGMKQQKLACLKEMTSVRSHRVSRERGRKSLWWEGFVKKIGFRF